MSWMVEVGEEFSSRQETLHLAVALLDRFLSATEVQIQNKRTLDGHADTVEHPCYQIMLAFKAFQELVLL